MPIARYNGLVSLNYDSVSGRHWEPGQTRPVSAAEMYSLIAAGNFSDDSVANFFQVKMGRETGARRPIVSDKVWGAKCDLFPLLDKTGWCTERAPVVFDAVRMKVTCSENTAAAFSGSIAIGERWNDGIVLQNAAGTTLTPTAATWDPASPFNPDGTPGGNATTNIANVAGATRTENRVDGFAYSDWVKPATIITAADIAGGNAYVQGRIYSAGKFPGSTGNNIPASDYAKAVPFFSQGYWYGNQLLVASPASPQYGAYGLSVEFQYRAIAAAQCHGFFHDSIPLGYPATLAQISGWPRLLIRWLDDTCGIPVSCLNQGHETDQAWLFLYRALHAVSAGQMTHAWVQPWSVNNTGIGGSAPTYRVNENIAVVKQILAAAETNNIWVNLIEPLGLKSLPSVNAVLGPFLDACESNGIGVVRQSEIWLNTDQSAWKTGLYFDGTHPADDGHPLVLRNIQASPRRFGL